MMDDLQELKAEVADMKPKLGALMAENADMKSRLGALWY
jgi:regulator of replication initiation timing